MMAPQFEQAASLLEPKVRLAKVNTEAEPHLAAWLSAWAECLAPADLFPEVAKRGDSFMQWWKVVSRGMASAEHWLTR